MNKKQWGGARKGAGRQPLQVELRKHGAKIYITQALKDEILIHGKGSNFSEKCVEMLISEINNRKLK